MSSIPESQRTAASAAEPQQGRPMDRTKDPARRTLDDRFDTIGWGLLFLLFGALAMPSGMVMYASVAGVGGLLLGLNGARLAARVPVRWFSIILGAAFLGAGLGAMAGVKMTVDAFVVVFVALGLATIAEAVTRSR